MYFTLKQIQKLNLNKEELLQLWNELDEVDSGDNLCQTFDQFIRGCESRFGVVPTEYYDDYPNLVYCWTYKGVKYEEDERKLVEDNDEIFQAWSEDLIYSASLCGCSSIQDYLKSIVIERYFDEKL